MRCKECGNNNFTFDNILGEKVCDDCGLVTVEEIFERVTSSIYMDGLTKHWKEGDTKSSLGSQVGYKTEGNKIGSKLRRTATRHNKTSYERTIETGIRYCMLVASEYPISFSIKEQISNTYVTLLRKHNFRGWTYEERAGAVTFYTLKDNGIRTTIKEMAKYSGADTNRIHKLTRKIASILHRPWVLSQTNPIGDIEKYCQDLDMDFSFTRDCIKVYSALVLPFEQYNKQFNLAAISSIIYIASLLTNLRLRQIDIASKLEISEVSIRANLKKICIMIGIDQIKIKQTNSMYLSKLTLEEFTHGVFK